MEVNKVEFGGRTLIDLTGDTTSEETLLEGEIGHNAKGQKVIGGAKVPDKLSQLENDMEFRPIIHTTKQEYESLPEDKLTDGKMYLTEDESPESNVVGLVDINEAINGVVLWENPDPSAEFAAQTVTLNDNIEKYEYVEATYIIEKTNINIKGATGKIEKNALQNFRFVITYINGFMYIRDVYTIDGKNVQISDCYERPQYGTFDSEITNAYLIPIKIIGYPKADFAAIDGVLPDGVWEQIKEVREMLISGNVTTTLLDADGKALMDSDGLALVNTGKIHIL